MAALDSDTSKEDEKSLTPTQDATVGNLVEAVAKVALQDSSATDNLDNKIIDAPARPLKIYSRSQVLHLYQSPLVKVPDGMPPLKDWFGDWNEQQLANKKESETSSASNARERRFRRDQEDGDTPSRPSFRSTLSQPSQMGNFRHQSLRTNDRDKDRDVERERERDLRDKEGQERLRNLSDKYDRDRLALSSTSTNLRIKERDSAPHLASGTSSRLGQAQGSNTTNRRNEGRDASKRKIGESSEDWRRGPESTRAGRDDRSDNSRRDRERPRSRIRDSSRPRRDPSSNRRDRDRDRDERERERDRPRDRRGDGDREDYRKDRDEHLRRDRDDYARRDWDDFYNRSDRDRDEHYQRDNRDRHEYSRHQREVDRDVDDDPRRWRDDGKRDERVAARRERERLWYDERDKERPIPPEDRDGRPKRGAARERRAGGAPDDIRDREDRRERDRDREVEPAWMETYVPSSTGGGILGGKSGDGELDGIQAWKKGMKEKERKDKENDPTPEVSRKPDTDRSAPSPISTSVSTSPAAPETQLDEIQLFKLLMKREAEKKEGEKSRIGQAEFGLPPRSTPPRAESTPSNPIQEQPKVLSAANDDNASANSRLAQTDVNANAQPALEESTILSVAQPHSSKTTKLSPQLDNSTATPFDGSQSLFSVLISSGSNETSLSSHTLKPPTPSIDSSLDGSRLVSSRSAPISSPPGMSTSTNQSSEVLPPNHMVANSSASATFNPPPGSRLLAFGSRVPSGGDVIPSKSHPSLEPAVGQASPPGIPSISSHKFVNMPPSVSTNSPMTGSMHHLPEAFSGMGPESHFGANARLTPSESSRSIRSFSPHGNMTQMGELHDVTSLGQMNDSMRRASVASAVERAAFGLPTENGASYVDLGGAANFSGSFDTAGGNVTGGGNYATGKGSRFAKFFDNKAREGQHVGVRKGQGIPGFTSTSPHPGPRQDVVALNGMAGNNGDARTMEDIFTMLQNSAQNHRVSPQLPHPSRIQPSGSPFGQNQSELHALQQQQLHLPQHFAQNSHIDSLYDSRLDDRNFVPDGMVPGLRPAAPRSRSREPSGVLFNDQLDDPLHFNVQRLQQQRNLDQVYPGPIPSMYSQQQQAAMLRNGGIPLQQAQFRGAPSPIANQNSLQGSSHRLPPGLANLGGRPPHDPSQYLGGPMVSGGLQSGLHGGSPAPQAYNNFGGGGPAFGGNPQVRGPLGPQNPLGLNSIAGLGLQNSMELRGANQAQLLGMGGGNLGGGLRGAAPGFGPQHVSPSQLPGAHANMRQPQHLPPHVMPHLLPPHLQQPQQGQLGGNAQGAQDLMALLMGHGGHRD
ncbi:hypothetical protein AcV5_004428 [Taiwanofungus camphoratus]|nr:hypothetical protein AcV5_004428 [Antrodia cinnamomea]